MEEILKLLVSIEVVSIELLKTKFTSQDYLELIGNLIKNEETFNGNELKYMIGFQIDFADKVGLDFGKILRIVNNFEIYNFTSTKIKFKERINWEILLLDEFAFKIELSNYDPRDSLKDFNTSLNEYNKKLREIVDEQINQTILTKYKPGQIIQNLYDWANQTKINDVKHELNRVNTHIKDFLYKLIGIQTKHKHPNHLDVYSVKSKLSYREESKLLQLNLIKLVNIKFRNMDIKIDSSNLRKTEYDFDFKDFQLSLETPKDFDKEKNPKKSSEFSNYAHVIYRGLSRITCLNAVIMFKNIKDSKNIPLFNLELNPIVIQNNLELLKNPEVLKIINEQNEFADNFLKARKNEKEIFELINGKFEEIKKKLDKGNEQMEKLKYPNFKINKAKYSVNYLNDEYSYLIPKINMDVINQSLNFKDLIYPSSNIFQFYFNNWKIYGNTNRFNTNEIYNNLKIIETEYNSKKVNYDKIFDDIINKKNGLIMILHI